MSLDDARKTKAQLVKELKSLRTRVSRLERGETKRRAAEEVLHDVGRPFRNLLDYIPGVSVQGYYPDGTVFYWNKASETLYGYPADEAIGKNLGDLIVPPDLRPLFEQCLQVGKQVRRSGEFMPSGELRLPHKDGHAVPVYSIHTAVYLEGEEPLLFRIDVDLSDRRKAEKTLRESEERFRQLAENIQEVFWIYSLPGERMIYVSPAFEQVWGRPRKGVYEQPHGWPESVHPEDRQRVQAAFEKRLTGEYDEEFRIERPGGEVRWVRDRAFPIRDPLGQVYRIAGVAEDITERKRAEREREGLQRLSLKLTEPLSAKELGRVVVEESRRLFEQDAFILQLLAPSEKQLVTVYAEDTFVGATEPTEVHPGQLSLVDLEGCFLFEDKAVLINRPEGAITSDLPRFGDTSRLSRSSLFVPIRWKGRALGILSVQSYTTGRYGPEDLHLLQSFADQCGGALARVRAEEETRVKMRHISTVHETARLAMDLDQPGALARSILDILRNAMPVDAFSFARHHEAVNQTRGILLADILDGEFQSWPVSNTGPLKDSPLNRSLRRGEPVMELRREGENVDASLRVFGDSQRRSASLMFAPMTYQGEMKGIMSVQSYQYEAYTPADLELLADVANIAAVALSRFEAEEALRESELQYRSTIDSMPAAIHVVDPEMRVLLFNHAFKEWNASLGLSCEVIGKNLFEVFPFLSDRTREEYRQVLDMGQTLITEEMTRVGTREIVTETRKVPVFEQGKVTRIITIVEDITLRRKSDEAMLRASRMEATATLAGGIAHDFNNLMVGVLGNAELLRIRCTDRPQVLRMADNISQAAQRAGELAQQMLAFARGGKYEPKPLNLNDTVQETLRLQERSFPPRIRIERDIEPELWNVEADPAQMSQVLMNLCINAVEAIEGNGRIILTTRNAEIDAPPEETPLDLEPGRYVYMSVEDTGRGMSPETAKRVFEPFFSTKFQGRGLGLSAVYGIIKNHNGRITVYSEPAQGATFKVYLPATTAERIADPEPESELPSGTETILVIDDEEMVVTVTCRMLERLGYRVLCARNGEEAVKITQSFDGDIHLALLDMGMPIMGGAEAYPRLREIRPALKVVICSGYELDASSQALLDAGASAFLQKPFRVTTLARALRRALEA